MGLDEGKTQPRNRAAAAHGIAAKLQFIIARIVYIAAAVSAALRRLIKRCPLLKYINKLPPLPTATIMWGSLLHNKDSTHMPIHNHHICIGSHF